MFFAGCTLLAIPVLIPINLIDGVGETGLPSMAIGNVAPGWRLWFHLVLTYIFCMAAILLLWREMWEYTRRRHAYLLSQKHAKMPQSTTILVTAIPKGLNNEEALYDIFNRFPGGVAKIWLNRQPKDLMKLCKERDEVVEKLELAEYDYIRSAYGKTNKKDAEPKEPQRPVGRISRIPCVGEKVDLIDYYTDKLCELNHQIGEAQRTGSLESLNSAFIQFHSQFAAHSAVQTVVHPTPFSMRPVFAEISPLDVIWENMNLNTPTRKGRHMVILVATTALILLCTIPTVIISSIATIADITIMFPFLSFLNNLPQWILGILQGILPPLLLVVLMALLPLVLTVMATYEGHERHTSVTLSVMTKYFFFLVVNVLLISTISGGILKTIDAFREEGLTFDFVVKRISEKLPAASTFFITYVLLQGLTGPPMELLQIVPLLLNFVFTQTLAKSPRQIWGVQGRLESVNYGILFPPVTLMFCIGMLYATVAPLILPFVTLYYTLYYFVFRHQFLYVYHQPIETGGLAFPKAVKQVYTGIFISEITLFCLFLLKLHLRAIPQMILVLILIVITAVSLSNMNEAFEPLVTFVPVGLFSKELRVDKDGVVTDGNETSQKGGDSRYRGDEEEHEYAGHYGHYDDRIGMSVDNLSRCNLTSETVPTVEMKQLGFESGKREYPDDIKYDLEEDMPPSTCRGELSFTKRSFQPRSASYDDREWMASKGSKDIIQRPPARSQRSLDRLMPEQQNGNRPRLDGPVSFLSRPMSFDPSNDNSNSTNNNSHSNNNSYGGLDRPMSYFSPEFGEVPQVETPAANTELERLQDQAYCHPAIYNVQRPVWLPMDERGLIQVEIDKLRRLGIVVATDGAVLDASRAKARVSGLIYAPGEETQYRLERGE
ncbi:hypothetical protein BGX28_002146 [Mortierella sp. GBA30]|nr:hypothetical protein BGX28_002146 [Mortierella sp. GBA30]